MIRRAHFISPILIGLVVISSAFGPCAAWAQDDPPNATRHDDPLWQRDVLTGDWGGARHALEDKGYRIGVNVTTEVLANATGGVSQGAIYEDLIEADLDVDLQKAVGWNGALIHANGYLTHGRGLSTHHLGNNILTVSNIEADRGDRLFDLWLQQTLLQGALSIRLGQIAASEEFLVSRTAALFLNGSYGWPAIMSANLPSSGPNYPLATPGARITYAPSTATAVSVGVFNGDPAGPGPGSPLVRDPSGTNFRFQDGVFFIAEATYRAEPSSSGADFTASYKLGGWYHTGHFSDQRYDALGNSLAAVSAGPPAIHHNDYGVYFVADRGLWRSSLGQHAMDAFVRIAFSPSSRNLVTSYVDAGVTYKGVLKANDSLGFALIYAGIGGAARSYDRDVQRLLDPSHLVRNFEGDLEVTYQTTVAPWWIVQPDVQVVLHPGGTVALPGGPVGHAVPSAFVLGLRSVIVL
jgi:porin